MQSRLRRIYVPKIRTFVVLAIFALLILFTVKATTWSLRMMAETGISPLFTLRLLFDDGAPLRATDDRTNVLVLGVAGGAHAGSDLTDTIMVLSFNNTTRSFAMISVPRDIWSDTLQDKINSAYHYGEEKSREAGSGFAGQISGGLVLAKAVIAETIGLPIHYGLVVDFSGFQEMIDLVGGIDVMVPRAFTDPQFPIAGREDDTCDGDPDRRCQYETLHFDEGLQHMVGETALKYVRSRHAEGEEGSDFARSRRQQDVLLALKEKLMQPGTWVSPANTSAIVGILDRATEMDLNMGELLTVGKRIMRTPDSRIQKLSLEDQLTSPPTWLYGRYVLVPTESFERLHEFIKEKLQ